MTTLNISMGVAGFKGPENVQVALDTIKGLGIKEIDTAEIYGDNEATLGAVGAAEQGFAISTKNPGGFGTGALVPATIKEKTDAAFARLKVDQVDILYIHAPDPTASPAEYAPVFDELYRAGRIRRFGISNFSPAQTRELYDYSKAHGLVLPTVYQGNYNAVSRRPEAELLPLLRELGITFYAYSPIAGGFLTKTRKALEEGSADGRFRAVKPDPLALMYRGFYLKPALLEGLGRWEELARQQDVPQAELAYRWIYYHSALDTSSPKGDFLILGASKVDQITQTIEGLKRGPLKPEVVKGIDELWDIVKDEAIENNYEASNGVAFSSKA